MQLEYFVVKPFWSKAASTTCFIHVRVLIHHVCKFTPFELWYSKKPKIHYFHVLGSPCYVLNTQDNLDKFDAKSDNAIFLGYSPRNRSYRVYNKIA